MLSMVIVLAVGAGAPAEQARLSRPGTCAVVTVRSPQPTDFRLRFSATRIIDLEFDAAPLAKFARTEPLTLKVFTPNGHLYATLALSLASAQGSRRPEPWRPSRMTARLPVAGTPIVTSSLYGRWTVVPYRDGESDACGRRLGFWIEP
jgi:hypothetical protein